MAAHKTASLASFRFRDILSHLVVVAIIAGLDALLGRSISLWVPLLIPIGLATWNLGWRAGATVAAVSVITLVLQVVLFGTLFGNVFHVFLNNLSKASVFAIVILLIDLVRRQQMTLVWRRMDGRLQRFRATEHGGLYPD